MKVSLGICMRRRHPRIPKPPPYDDPQSNDFDDPFMYRKDVRALVQRPPVYISSSKIMLDDHNSAPSCKIWILPPPIFEKSKKTTPMIPLPPSPSESLKLNELTLLNALSPRPGKLILVNSSNKSLIPNVLFPSPMSTDIYQETPITSRRNPSVSLPPSPVDSIFVNENTLINVLSPNPGNLNGKRGQLELQLELNALPPFAGFDSLESTPVMMDKKRKLNGSLYAGTNDDIKDIQKRQRLTYLRNTYGFGGDIMGLV